MTTFTHLLEELVQQTVALTPAEVKRMVERYGDRTLQMGNLAVDGSLQIPVDCILEAVHVLGNQKVGDALHGFQAERVATDVESVEALMENVISARRYGQRKCAVGGGPRFCRESDHDSIYYLSD